MKKILFSLALVAVFCLAFPSVHAGEEMPPIKSNPRFDTIKDLEGTWKGKSKMHGEEKEIEVTYKVTSNGSAVEETFLPGTPHEMVSVYFLAGDDIYMTHYCALGNQPHMKLKSGKGKKLVFETVVVSGLSSPDAMYMGGVTLKPRGKNKLEAEWVSYENGEPKDKSKTTLTRVN